MTAKNLPRGNAPATRFIFTPYYIIKVSYLLMLKYARISYKRAVSP